MARIWGSTFHVGIYIIPLPGGRAARKQRAALITLTGKIPAALYDIMGGFIIILNETPSNGMSYAVLTYTQNSL